MFMFWLTASRLRMLDGALSDDDLTANMARDIFRLDPPVLDVFDAGNLRQFALLSGFSVLLWNWSLFFGISTGLTFSATIVQGAAVSVNETPAFTMYGLFALGVGAYGVASVARPLRRILERLHGGRLKIGLVRIVVAGLLFVGGILATSPDLPRVMFYEDDWQPLPPSRANALNGETLLLEGGRIVVLAGIDALRPGQTCFDAGGVAYPCGAEATTFLQSLVQDDLVACFLTYPGPRWLRDRRGRGATAEAAGRVQPPRACPDDGERWPGLRGGRRRRAARRTARRSAAPSSGRLARVFRAATPLGCATRTIAARDVTGAGVPVPLAGMRKRARSAAAIRCLSERRGGRSPQAPVNAWMPVWARPRISAWMSWVPS